MIHHPAFQSLALPLLLALLGMAVVRAAAGDRQSAWGGVLGLLGALAWLPGFEWPADSRTQKLPWIALAGLVLAGLERVRLPRGGWAHGAWAGAALVWAASVPWLAGRTELDTASVLALGFGWTVLWVLAWARPADAALGVSNAAVLAGAALALSALAATGGSLLVAQLAAMLATAIAAVTGWAWWRRHAGETASSGVWMAFGLAWLAIAWIWILSAPAAATGPLSAGLDRGLRVAGLALALAVAAVLARLPKPARAARWRPCAVVAVASLPIALVLVWPGAAAGPADALDPEDPYLTPAPR